jgi:hypothetical protein
MRLSIRTADAVLYVTMMQKEKNATSRKPTSHTLSRTQMAEKPVPAIVIGKDKVFITNDARSSEGPWSAWQKHRIGQE